MKVFIIVISVCFSLISCQRQKLEQGIITKKWYEPERTYTMLMPMTILSNKTPVVIILPYIIHDNEDWCIKISDVTEKGDTVSSVYYVPHEKYDTLYVGKFVCIDGDCDKNDNNNTKEKQDTKQTPK